MRPASMAAMTTIRPVDLRDDADLAAYHAVEAELHRESWPDDPARPAAELRKEVELMPAFVTHRLWVAFEEGEPVGLVRVRWRGGEDNQDLAMIFGGVVPSQRGRGIAAVLMRAGAQAALDAGRTKVIIDSDSMVPVGASVLERWGGKKAMVARISRLDLAALDAPLMDAWIAQGRELCDEFELLFWQDRVPSEHVEAFAALHDVMNSAPLEDLDVEPFVLTPEQLLAYEDARVARGYQWWATVVRHKPSGEFAGFTDMVATSFDRTVLHQGDTGVWHKYRGKGLGRWIKAYHLGRVRGFVPEARWVQTGNAGTNRPMLNINEQMGFFPYKHITGWQFVTADLVRRVTRSPAA